MIFLYASPTIAHNGIIRNPSSASFVSNNPLEDKFSKEKQRADQLEQQVSELQVELNNLKKSNDQREFYPRILLGSIVSLGAVVIGLLTDMVSTPLFGFGIIVFISGAHPRFIEPVVGGISKLIGKFGR